MPMRDRQVFNLIKKEEERQAKTLNLIASENYVSRETLLALGSVFVNKYAEGYAGARYYAGNKFSDELELLAKKRALELFGLSPKKWEVNVQPYSGSPANLAIHLGLVSSQEKVMGMDLSMGGHLTHGHKVSATGKFWQHVSYGISKETEKLDLKEVEKIALENNPKMIIAGYTAYSREVPFKGFSKIAKKVGAYLLADVSHIAGLIAGGAHPSPFPFADVVMMTTHKTLRGPRAAIIFSKKEISEKIDKAVFPGLQGGPHLNQIAALAVALEEAKTTAFKKYAKQIVKNSKTLSLELKRLGWRIVSGGTDTHLFLMDVTSGALDGASASESLEREGIIVNKNSIPYDIRSPKNPSGIRLGTSALTTRGMKEREMKEIAKLIDITLRGGGSVRGRVSSLCKRFPIK